jgi:hypothetical protein
LLPGLTPINVIFGSRYADICFFGRREKLFSQLEVRDADKRYFWPLYGCLPIGFWSLLRPQKRLSGRYADKRFFGSATAAITNIKSY